MCLQCQQLTSIKKTKQTQGLCTAKSKFAKDALKTVSAIHVWIFDRVQYDVHQDKSQYPKNIGCP